MKSSSEERDRLEKEEKELNDRRDRFLVTMHIENLTMRMEGLFEKLNNKIDNLENKLEKRIQEVENKFENFENKFEKRLNDLENRFESKFNQIDARFNKIEENFRSLNNKVYVLWTGAALIFGCIIKLLIR